MRAVILGNKDLAVGCLDILLKHGINVVGIVLNPDDNGQETGWYKSLRKAAIEKGIPYYQPINISCEDGVSYISSLKPDLLFSFSYSRIIKEIILNQAKSGAFNIHFSMLPHYRGCLPIVYALSNGDSKIGVTLHYMDEGIDTGDIVSQCTIDVENTDTAYSLYFKCVELGIKLLDQTIPAIINGEAQRISQNINMGSYNKQYYPNDRWIQSGWSLDKISCFIRAHTFEGYPTARILLDSKEYNVTYKDGFFYIPALDYNPLTIEDIFEIALNTEIKNET